MLPLINGLSIIENQCNDCLWYITFKNIKGQISKIYMIPQKFSNIWQIISTSHVEGSHSYSVACTGYEYKSWSWLSHAYHRISSNCQLVHTFRYDLEYQMFLKLFFMEMCLFFIPHTEYKVHFCYLENNYDLLLNKASHRNEKIHLWNSIINLGIEFFG